MDAADVERETERQRIRARIEQLRPEWEALHARLEEINRARERRPHPPEVRCQVHLVAAATPPGQEPALAKALPGVGEVLMAADFLYHTGKAIGRATDDSDPARQSVIERHTTPAFQCSQQAAPHGL